MNKLLKNMADDEFMMIFLDHYPKLFSSSSFNERRKALKELFENLVASDEETKEIVYLVFRGYVWENMVPSLNKYKSYHIFTGSDAIMVMLDSLYVLNTLSVDDAISYTLDRIRSDEERMKEGEGVSLTEEEVEDVLRRINNELHLFDMLGYKYGIKFAIVDAGLDETYNGLFGMRDQDALCILLNGNSHESAEMMLVYHVAEYISEIIQETWGYGIPYQIKTSGYLDVSVSRTEVHDVLSRILAVGIAEMIHADPKALELLYEKENELGMGRKSREFYIRSIKVVMRKLGQAFHYEDTDKFFDWESSNLRPRE